MPLTLAQAFNPRANSIGFLRWLMAFMVIFSHAGPLGGFYDGKDLGTQWSDEQSLGGVAVSGFFFLSGFLITRSRMGRASTGRYFWRRVLRIFPAFWLSLLVVAFVFAPIAWLRVNGTLSGYLSAPQDSPLTYFFNNMWLPMNQNGIAGLGVGIPFYAVSGGGFDWNGSAWTLAYEFTAYILVGILGAFGALANRKVGGLVAGGILVLAAMQWLWAGDPSKAFPFLSGNIYFLLLLAPFAFGMVFALFGDKIPIDDRIAVGAAIIAVLTYGKGGWLAYGQYFFMYALMWFAIRATKLNRWERFGDFSYGIYIFAWPVMYLASFFGLENEGWLVYHLVIVFAVHVLAFLSWHLIEKPAMSLKDWTPRWLDWILRTWWSPVSLALKRRLVDPRYSSTAFAAGLRAEAINRSGDGSAS